MTAIAFALATPTLAQSLTDRVTFITETGTFYVGANELLMALETMTPEEREIYEAADETTRAEILSQRGVKRAGAL